MISVTTPSIRPEFLEVIARCLKRQTYQDFRWLIGSPQDLFLSIDRQIGHDYDFEFVAEPPKKEGDYYSLNKCWNALFRQAKGELIVNIVDGLWFPPDILERLWAHYEANPKACVGAVGDQYDQIENGKPEHCVWKDPRKRTDYGSFWEINPNDLELCIASIPLQAIKDVGGIDEEYDRGAACSEKELCYRMDKIGYKFFLDQSLEYRAIKHPRLGGSEEWDKHYLIACDMLSKHLKEINAGTRLKLPYL